MEDSRTQQCAGVNPLNADLFLTRGFLECYGASPLQ